MTGARNGTAGWGLGRGSWGAVAALALAACANTPAKTPAAVGALAELPTGLLEPGKLYIGSLVGKGEAPVLTLVSGQLPDGLSLEADGTVRGVPTTPGEHQRFAVEAYTQDGEPLGERSYQLAVGVAATNLTGQPTANQDGDQLTFSFDWGRPLRLGYGWDPQLGLLWPLRVGAGVNGKALAPAGSTFSLVVAGPEAQGRFDLAPTVLDERAGAIAQLTWKGEADVDLQLVPEPALQLAAATNKAPRVEEGGVWVARHELEETTAPGPEAVTLSYDARPGRYLLVATKAGGDAVDLELWLSVRRRDGGVLAERRVRALLSDVSSGTLADDVSAGRQSYRPLGFVVVGPDHDVHFELPGDAQDPFAPGVIVGGK